MSDFDDPFIYNVLLNVCCEYRVDPSSSIEMENFFRNLLLNYESRNDLTKWLQETLSKHFISINSQPQWIQGAEWPIFNGKPMIFAGQINLPSSNLDFYHDDSSLYVFIASESEPVVVFQQY